MPKTKLLKGDRVQAYVWRHPRNDYDQLLLSPPSPDAPGWSRVALWAGSPCVVVGQGIDGNTGAITIRVKWKDIELIVLEENCILYGTGDLTVIPDRPTDLKLRDRVSVVNLALVEAHYWQLLKAARVNPNGLKWEDLEPQIDRLEYLAYRYPWHEPTGYLLVQKSKDTAQIQDAKGERYFVPKDAIACLSRG